MKSNVDITEMYKFSYYAKQWWNKHGLYASLHIFNNTRLRYVISKIDIKNEIK